MAGKERPSRSFGLVAAIVPTHHAACHTSLPGVFDLPESKSIMRGHALMFQACQAGSSAKMQLENNINLISIIQMIAAQLDWLQTFKTALANG